MRTKILATHTIANKTHRLRAKALGHRDVANPGGVTNFAIVKSLVAFSGAVNELVQQNELSRL